MIKKTLPVLIAAASGVFATQAANAIENIELYGFASFAAGTTFNEEELPNGEDSVFGPVDRTTYTDEVRYRPESVIGIQIDADLSEGLKLKTLLQADGEKDYDAEMKWAFAEFDAGGDVTFQAGRQPLPLYYYTDFIDVAYSYRWVRPPMETYFLQNSTFDGVQLKWEPMVGDYEYRFQVYHGRDENEDINLTLNDVTGVVAFMRKDWFEVRASHAKSNVETAVIGGAAGATVETPTSFTNLTLKAGTKSAYITAEWQRDDESKPIQVLNYLDESQSWYISAGYGVDNFVPYVTYAERENSLSDENPFLAEDAKQKSESWTGGVRWDFHSNAAFKMEYTARKDKSDDTILALTGEAKTVDALTVAIDMVF